MSEYDGYLILCFALTLSISTNAEEDLYMGFCRDDLGMSSGAIPDGALSASSSYDEKSVGPHNSRIRQEKNGGAWCPKRPITKELQEWLQIDLQEVKVISLVETQGRFGNGQGQEFAPNYLLEYQREESRRWIRYRDKKATELMKGNSNTYIAELRELRPPIIARRIRFLPWSSHPRTTCLRVELYGCPWTDGVLSYSMQQGDKRGPEIDLYDLTYDGQISDGYLSGGLGQLMDFEEGNTNFRLDQYNTGRRGFEWVGWKNDSNSTHPLEIVFHFDRLRNFSAIQIHVNNFVVKDVSVFQRLVIYFSWNGLSYGQDAVVFNYAKDLTVEMARHVIVPIPHRAGRVVKLAFFFDARWILISEIRFFSELVKNPENLLSRKFDAASEIRLANSTQYGKDEDAEEGEEQGEVGMEETGQDGHRIAVTALHRTISGTALRNWLHQNLSTLLNTDTDGNIKLSADASARKWQDFNDTNFGILVGAVIGFLVVVAAFFVILFFHHRRKTRFRDNSSTFKSVLSSAEKNQPLQLASLPTANNKTSNGLIYCSLATSDVLVGNKTNMDLEFKGTTFRRFEEPSGSQQEQTPIYEIPLSFALMPQHCAEVPLRFADSQPLDPALAALMAPSGQNTVAVLQGLTQQRTQGPTFGTFCVSASPHISWKEDAIVPEILWEDLVFVEKLGEGLFGEVHLCQLKCGGTLMNAEMVEPRDSQSQSLVAVKILRQNPSEQDWLDFQKELKILSHLNDPNILQVFGRCIQSGVPAIVLEYMMHGDLFQFLKDSILENSTPDIAIVKRCLSYGSLVYMAKQIASGMKYLESLNLVHRDLATRNCLVGQKYTIKIADFGMSRSIYSNDYCDWEGSDLLPIRWMAWESILLGRFSCKTDVWSFGVTLWEILGLARERPFSSLSNEEVIENCEHVRIGDEMEQSLPQPSVCPKEVYDLMRQCWSRDDAQRPTFREIHMFLQHRNIGYDPEKGEVSSVRRAP